VIEFVLLCAAWLALLIWVSRKGTKHFLRPHLAITLPLAGGLAAALFEALPLCAISPGFTLRTAIAVFGGVLAARLFGRIAHRWAEAHEKRAAAGPVAPPRLVHPLIAIGLFVAGVPVTWFLVTANLSLIEELTTPRDEKTGIVHGSEEIRIDHGADRAVLLLHGLYRSPADFQRLAPRLEAAGFDVYAPLLPGHGRKPDDLDGAWADDYRKAARKGFDELAAKHARVAVVGGSMSSALALLLAAERKPAAMVLASPYLGHLATPSWCPVQVDSLVGPLSRIARRVFVDEDLRGRGYSVQSLHALRQCRDLARGVDAAAKDVACPTLVIVGMRDVVVPPQFTIDWASTHLGDRATTTRLEASGHDIYFDVEGEAAVEATARFVEERVPK
jgi:carboxylesterase